MIQSTSYLVCFGKREREKKDREKNERKKSKKKSEKKKERKRKKNYLHEKAPNNKRSTGNIFGVFFFNYYSKEINYY